MLPHGRRHIDFRVGICWARLLRGSRDRDVAIKVSRKYPDEWQELRLSRGCPDSQWCGGEKSGEVEVESGREARLL